MCVPQAGAYGDMPAEYAPPAEEERGGAEAARPPEAAEPSSAQRLPRPVLQTDENGSPVRAPPAPAILAPEGRNTRPRRRTTMHRIRSGSDCLRIWLRCFLACVPVLYIIFC